MHAWEAPTEAVTQAVTKVEGRDGDEDNRPDAPDIEGQCQVAGCTVSAGVPCWSNTLDHGFLFCEDHASTQTDEYDDLEVAR